MGHGVELFLHRVKPVCRERHKLKMADCGGRFDGPEHRVSLEMMYNILANELFCLQAPTRPRNGEIWMSSDILHLSCQMFPVILIIDERGEIERPPIVIFIVPHIFPDVTEI